MKVFIEVEVTGPENELAGAAQLIVDKSNAMGRINVPGSNLSLSNYKVYEPPASPVVKAKRVAKASPKKAAKKIKKVTK
jgi:hypothetical protein